MQNLKESFDLELKLSDTATFDSKTKNPKLSAFESPVDSKSYKAKLSNVGNVNTSSKTESLDLSTLERVRNAYQAVLQSQLYTRDMLGRISGEDLDASLDKPQNLKMSDKLKAMHENLVPYEM